MKLGYKKPLAVYASGTNQRARCYPPPAPIWVLERDGTGAGLTDEYGVYVPEDTDYFESGVGTYVRNYECGQKILRGVTQ